VTRVQIQGVVKRFGSVTALEGVDISVEPGEFFTLLGPSGCGKTTLLRAVAGFLVQDAGAIYFDAECIDGIPAHKRNTGMVFQNYAIFPHLNVFDNIAYGLKNKRISPRDIEAKVHEAVRLVRLEGLEHRMPRELSGGQQQRVVLARALVIEPRVLLMDEPLSNLDAKLRVAMRGDIRALQRNVGITTIYVTHDQEEALAISDRIAVMSDGRVQQIGRPWEVYLQPANQFVADFVGATNLLKARLVKHEVETGGAWFDVGLDSLWQASMPATARGEEFALAVRPESLFFVEPGAAVEGRNLARGQIGEATYGGAVIRYRVQVENGPALLVEVHHPDYAAIRPLGECVLLACDSARVLVFEKDNRFL
jgi:iron(III) transport system ATP-binding protein